MIYRPKIIFNFWTKRGLIDWSIYLLIFHMRPNAKPIADKLNCRAYFSFPESTMLLTSEIIVPHCPFYKRLRSRLAFRNRFSVICDSLSSFFLVPFSFRIPITHTPLPGQGISITPMVNDCLRCWQIYFSRSDCSLWLTGCNVWFIYHTCVFVCNAM